MKSLSIPEAMSVSSRRYLKKSTGFNNEVRQMLVEIDHPIAGKLHVVGAPAKLSKTPGRVSRAAPTLGEHTDEVLGTLLGYSDEHIQLLRDEGVI